MNTLEAITTRRSVRRFLEKPVENEQIEAVVSAASFAPSWKNTQTARYIAVTDPAAKVFRIYCAIFAAVCEKESSIR